MGKHPRRPARAGWIVYKLARSANRRNRRQRFVEYFLQVEVAKGTSCISYRLPGGKPSSLIDLNRKVGMETTF